MAELSDIVTRVTDVLNSIGTTEAEKKTLLLEFIAKMNPLQLSYKTYTADGVADMTKTMHLLDSGVDITAVTPAAIHPFIHTTSKETRCLLLFVTHR